MPNVLLHHLADEHTAAGGHRLFHVGTGAEQVRRQLPRRQRLAGVLGLDLLILGVAGKVEDGDRQPFLVQAVRNNGHAKPIGPHHPVLRLP